MHIEVGYRKKAPGNPPVTFLEHYEVDAMPDKAKIVADLKKRGLDFDETTISIVETDRSPQSGIKYRKLTQT
jgi:hypothetical protein